MCVCQSEGMCHKQRGDVMLIKSNGSERNDSSNRDEIILIKAVVTTFGSVFTHFQLCAGKTLIILFKTDDDDDDDYCPPPFLLQVRGAPAIAIVGCLSLAVELRAGAGGDDPVTFIRESLCHLTSARPTAVNMGRAARELMEFAENESMEKNSEQLRER